MHILAATKLTNFFTTLFAEVADEYIYPLYTDNIKMKEGEEKANGIYI